MNTKIESVIKKIDKLNVQLRNLQAECSHESVDAHYDSNTGNFDPMDDKYWVVVRCLDCDKRMSFDSYDHANEYRKFSKFVKR
jgi:hypothetical protein